MIVNGSACSLANQFVRGRQILTSKNNTTLEYTLIRITFGKAKIRAFDEERSNNI